MDRRSALFLTVVAAVAVVAAVSGLLPLAGQADSGPSRTPVPVDALNEPGGTDRATPPSGTATTPPPFSLAVEAIDPCGVTCRRVTLTLRNRQSQRATGVVISARLYAGQTTDSGAQVWRTTERVGTLPAGSAVTASERIELGLVGASRVQANGGWVTVSVSVRSAEANVTVTRQRRVA